MRSKPMTRLSLLAAFVCLLSCQTRPGTDTGESATGTETAGTTNATNVTTATTTTTTTSTSTSTSTTTTTGPETTSTTTTSTTSTTEVTTSTTEPVTSSTTVDTEGPPCTITECNGKVLACGDCIDNDNDGTVDSADVECISPCDDDENSFATGIPGDGMDPCKQDCFFDGNSGAGDDGCNWNLKCDPESPGAPECPYDPKASCADQQPEKCKNACKPPPGCDCFGCCSVYKDGELVDVFIGKDDCSIDNFDACTPCSKSADCGIIPCIPEMCIPCINQPLPPECDGAMCSEGFNKCDSDADCEMGQYCKLTINCCEPIPG